MAIPSDNQDLLLEEGIQFHEIWELIKKRRMIIYYFAGFVLLAALIRVQLQTPLFIARGTLLIEKEGRSQMNLLNQYYPYDNDWSNEYLNTQIRVLNSRSLARKVVKELERLPGQEKVKPVAKPGSLQKILGGEKKDEDPDAQLAGAASGFLGGLGVSNIPDTRLLEVSFISPDPKMAAHSVNTLFDKFIEFNLEMKAEATKQAAEFLTVQIEDMRRSLAQKEQELQEYGKRKELYYIRGEDSTVVQKLSDLNGAYTAAQIERINKESIYRELKGKPFDNYPDVRVNSLIQGLKQEFSARESEIKKKSQIFQDSYPEMQRLRSQQEGLQKRIESETADVARKALNQAEAEYQAALKKENALAEMLNQQKGSVVSSNANAIYYNSLKIEVENMRNLLDFLTRKQKESMLSSRLEGLNTSNIKIVDRAEIPSRPFSPNKQRTLLLALMMGIGGGIFLIFALNYLDNTVKSPEEVEKLLRLPALGFIPAVGVKSSQSYYNHYYSDRKKQTVGTKDQDHRTGQPQGARVDLCRALPQYPHVAPAFFSRPAAQGFCSHLRPAPRRQDRNHHQSGRRFHSTGQEGAGIGLRPAPAARTQDLSHQEHRRCHFFSGRPQPHRGHYLPLPGRAQPARAAFGADPAQPGGADHFQGDEGDDERLAPALRFHLYRRAASDGHSGLYPAGRVRRRPDAGGLGRQDSAQGDRESQSRDREVQHSPLRRDPQQGQHASLRLCLFFLSLQVRRLSRGR